MRQEGQTVCTSTCILCAMYLYGVRDVHYSSTLWIVKSGFDSTVRIEPGPDLT